jgi:hypothetical protein
MSYDTPAPDAETAGSTDPLDERIDEHGAPTDETLPEVAPTEPNPLDDTSHDQEGNA